MGKLTAVRGGGPTVATGLSVQTFRVSHIEKPKQGLRRGYTSKIPMPEKVYDTRRTTPRLKLMMAEHRELSLLISFLNGKQIKVLDSRESGLLIFRPILSGPIIPA